MNYETFVKICQKCWEEKHGFLLISNDNEMDNGRYRIEFDQFIMIKGEYINIKLKVRYLQSQSLSRDFNVSRSLALSLKTKSSIINTNFFHLSNWMADMSVHLSTLICIMRFQILMKK